MSIGNIDLTVRQGAPRIRDNAALHFVVGATAIFILGRLWWAGTFAGWLAAWSTNAPQGFSGDGSFAYGPGTASVIGSIVYIAIQAAILVGMLLSSVWAGAFDVLRDGVVGLRLWIDQRVNPTIHPDAAAANEQRTTSDLASSAAVAQPAAPSDPLARVLEAIGKVDSKILKVHGNTKQLSERIKASEEATVAKFQTLSEKFDIAEEATDHRFQTVSSGLIEAANRIEAVSRRVEAVAEETAAKPPARSTRSRTKS